MNETIKEPSGYEKLHWWIFNSIAKVFGVMMILWSLIFAYSFIKDLLENKSEWYGLSATETFFAEIACLCFVLLGVAITKAKKYYPKEYIEYYSSKKKSSDSV
jgi:hypothetical protein